MILFSIPKWMHIVLNSFLFVQGEWKFKRRQSMWGFLCMWRRGERMKKKVHWNRRKQTVQKKRKQKKRNERYTNTKEHLLSWPWQWCFILHRPKHTQKIKETILPASDLAVNVVFSTWNFSLHLSEVKKIFRFFFDSIFRQKEFFVDGKSTRTHGVTKTILENSITRKQKTFRLMWFTWFVWISIDWNWIWNNFIYF